jgi:Family of unknown function (DUF6288)
MEFHSFTESVRASVIISMTRFRILIRTMQHPDTFNPPGHAVRHKPNIAALITVLVGFITLDCPAAPRGEMSNPDFTKGESIPEGANHDWTLGATGARGWMYSNRLETSEARQVAITKVDKGSPSDGTLQAGDVILGIEGRPFASDPRVAFGKALTAAEAGDGNLKLTRWREGSASDVVVNSRRSAHTAPPLRLIARSPGASSTTDAKRWPSA